MTRTALLTLGRLPKGLDIARALHAAGWRVVVAEPFARHLTGASNLVAASHVVTAPALDRARYLDDLAHVIAAEQAELVVPVSEETMHVAFLHERLAALPQRPRVFAMAPRTLLRLHDKLTFTESAGALGLPVPATALLGTAAAAHLAATGRTVVKPALSCSGRGVRFLEAGAALPPVPAQRTLVQRRVEGEVVSSFSIVHGGRVLGTVVYRGVVMAGTVAVCFERIDAPPAVESWVQEFAARTAFDGFLSFDFVLQTDGAAVAIECNPRATSGLHFVEPADLARAITAPAGVTALRYKPQRLLQQFWSTLTELQGALRDRERRALCLRALRQAGDVTWSARDPWPFVSMTWTSWTIIRMAMAARVPFGEVATLDVGWYDDALQGAALA